QQIQIAVPVEIAVSQSTPHFGCRETAAQLRCDVAKFALPVVQEKMRRLRVPMIAGDVAYCFIDMPVDGGKVEMPIQIGVQERASETEPHARSLPDSSRHSRIAVTAIALLAIKRHHLAVEIRDRDARHSGIVKI